MLVSLKCSVHQIHQLSFEDGKKFVCNSYRAWLICSRKRDLLGAFNWPFMQDLIEYENTINQKLRIIDRIDIGKISSIQALGHLEKTFQTDMFEIQNLSYNVIEDKLNEASRAHLLYNILLEYLGVDFMENLVLHDHVIGVTLKDKFIRIADEWTRDIFQRVYRYHEITSEENTSILELNMKKIEYVMLVIFMDFIEYSGHIGIYTFFKTATIEDIKDFMIQHGQNLNVQNNRVKNQIHTHHAKRRLFQIMRIFKSPPMKNILQFNPDDIKVSEIISFIENKRELNEERKPYTDEEINSLFSACEGDSKWTLILTILREVGLRVGAICNLKVCDIMNDFGQPKHEGRSVEKGNKIRTFIIGPNLKRKIVTYAHDYEKLIDRSLESQFIFGLENNKRPNISYIEQRLKIIAKKAGLETNVYPHLFRHTLVRVLEDSGNTMNEISKFMGHSNVDTTQKWYSIRTLHDIVENMNNPFYNVTQNNEEQEDEDYKDELSRAYTKLETCVSIISGIMNIVCEQDIIKIRDKMPNIDKVMRVIVDSCAGSTVATSDFI